MLALFFFVLTTGAQDVPVYTVEFTSITADTVKFEGFYDGPDRVAHKIKGKYKLPYILSLPASSHIYLDLKPSKKTYVVRVFYRSGETAQLRSKTESRVDEGIHFNVEPYER
jgi:hypothetical protein